MIPTKQIEFEEKPKLENDPSVRFDTEFVSFTYILFYIHVEYIFHRVLLSSLEDLSPHSFSKLPFQKSILFIIIAPSTILESIEETNHFRETCFINNNH